MNNLLYITLCCVGLSACVSGQNTFNPLDPLGSLLGRPQQQISSYPQSPSLLTSPSNVPVTTSFEHSENAFSPPPGVTTYADILATQEASSQIEKKKATTKYSCGRRKYCSNIQTCDEAYYLLRQCGLKKLDRDGDGVPCEKICPGG